MGRGRRQTLVLVLAAGTAEVLVLIALWATLLGITGLCTVEYTPELQPGSPRDLACNDGGPRDLLLWTAPLLVPLGAMFLWRRPRGMTGGLAILSGLTFVAIACLFAYARLIMGVPAAR